MYFCLQNYQIEVVPLLLRSSQLMSYVALPIVVLSPESKSLCHINEETTVKKFRIAHDSNF